MGHRAVRRISLYLLLSIFCAAPFAAAANLDLGAFKGKVVYLDFWASWCNPCRQSFPWMNEVQEVDGPKGLVIVAVNVDHDKALADGFLKRYAPQFKIVYDSEGQIASRYDFKDMPTSYLIGRDGRVRYVHAGFYPNQEGTYAAQIDELLNEPSH
jgi:thiol-disulfide isomerase/thioredoxin